MASTSVIGPVCAAALTRLKADTSLTAEVPAARIVDDMPARPVYPFVLVESAGERSVDTMGAVASAKWGSDMTLRTRIISQYRGESEVATILSLVKASLDGATLTVSGYPSVSCDFATTTTLRDTVAGVVTRELVADFTVIATQS